MDNPVAKGRRADLPTLRLIYVKMAVFARQIAAVLQFLLDAEQVRFPSKIKPHCFRFVPLATAAFVIGGHQVLPAHQRGPQISECFGHRHGLIQSGKKKDASGRSPFRLPAPKRRRGFGPVAQITRKTTMHSKLVYAGYGSCHPLGTGRTCPPRCGRRSARWCRADVGQC